MTENFHEELEVNTREEGETMNVDAAPSPESSIIENESGELSLEAVKTMADEEQKEIWDMLAGEMSKGGESVTAEELSTSDDPRVQEHLAGFLDQHPKVRRLVQAFTIATGLTAAGCAQTGGVAQVFTQGAMNQVNMEMQAEINRANVGLNQNSQERSAQLYAAQNAERMELQQRQERERFEVSRKNALRELMLRNPSNEQIEEFKVRWDNQHAQMMQRQKEQMETYGFNAGVQEKQRSLNYEQQQEQMALQRDINRQQQMTNMQNQVIQQGINIFLQRMQGR